MRKKKLAMPILAVLGIILSSCSTDEKTSTYPPFFSDFYYQPTVSSPSPLPLSLPDSDAYLETARTVVASLIGIEPEIASFPEGEINAMGPLPLDEANFSYKKDMPPLSSTTISFGKLGIYSYFRAEIVAKGDGFFPFREGKGNLLLVEYFDGDRDFLFDMSVGEVPIPSPYGKLLLLYSEDEALFLLGDSERLSLGGALFFAERRILPLPYEIEAEYDPNERWLFPLSFVFRDAETGERTEIEGDSALSIRRIGFSRVTSSAEADYPIIDLNAIRRESQDA